MTLRKCIGVTMIVSALVFLIGVNIPVTWLSINNLFSKEPTVGNVGVTTISTATNLADFPAIYNADTSALDTGKIDVGTTSVASITTLANLTSVGTIGTGVWSGTAIAVAKGGTGTTSPSLNQVMLGDTTNGFKVVTGWGTSGQSLVSNGVNTAPTWQSVSFDTAADFTVTGQWTMSKAIITAATSTNATTTGALYAGTFDAAAGGPTATTTAFTASGTWIKPANVSKVKVTVCGGGGGGGGSSDGGTDGHGGGGGAGGCAVAAVSVTGNVTVTIGSGGAGGDGANGTNGGNSTFAGATTITGSGGTGGVFGNNGVGAGGSGGSTTNGDYGITGEAGQAGTATSGVFAGAGGDSLLGFGAIRTSAAEAVGPDSTAGYGGGGAGGRDTTDNGSDVDGGAGKSGIVIVEWWEY